MVKLDLHLRDPRPRPTPAPKAGAPIFTGASTAVTVSFPSRYRCRPSPKCRLFPGPEYTSGSAPSWTGRRNGAPGRCSGPDARKAAGPLRSRVHCDWLDRGEPRFGPCGLSTATPQHFTMASRPVGEASSGVPDPKRVGTHGPYPPGSRRSSFIGRTRRFLAYWFPFRSPDPHHLAVPARSEFVGGACHRHGQHTDRAALLHRLAGTGSAAKVSHFPSNQQRLTAYSTAADCGPLPKGLFGVGPPSSAEPPG